MKLQKNIINLIKEEIDLLNEKLKKGFSISTLKSISEGLVDEDSRRYDKLIKYITETLGAPVGRGSSRLVWILSSNKVLKVSRFDSRAPKLKGAGRAQNKAEIDVFTNPVMKPIVAKIYDYDPSYFWIISEIAKPLTNSEIKKFLGIDSYFFNTLFNTFLKQRKTLTFEEFLKKEINNQQGRIEAYLESIDMLVVKKELAEDEIKDIEKEFGKETEDTAYLKADIRYFLESIEEKKERINAAQGMKKGYENLLAKEKFITLVNTLVEMNEKADFNLEDLVQSEHFAITADGRIIIIDYGFNDEVYRKFYR